MEAGGKQMHVSSRVLCLWPGLVRLWKKGDWPSLGLSIGFTLLFNLALISSFLWPELLGKEFPTVIWPVLGLVWLVSALESHRQLTILHKSSQKRIEDISPVPDTLFNQSQREYLRGNWSETAKLWKRRLQFRPRDVEARLLLATMFRHQSKRDLARNELQTMQRFDESQPWEIEIRNELDLLTHDQTYESEDVDDSKVAFRLENQDAEKERIDSPDSNEPPTIQTLAAIERDDENPARRRVA